MNTTTRLLKLCEEKKCCPLGLAWLVRDEESWFFDHRPDPGKAAWTLSLDHEACHEVAGDYDHAHEYKELAPIAMRKLLHLGGFCRPPKQLTRCERRWINA